MLNDVTRAEMDQAMAMMNEMFPGMIKGLFDGYKKEGFTEEQAFELVKTHILGLVRLK